MPRLPKTVRVETLERSDPLEGSDVRVCFTQAYGDTGSATNVERLTIAELRQAEAAIHEYLTVHDIFQGT